MSAAKKYLVTGGTGFIGSALVRMLLEEGQQVRVLDNNLRGSPERLSDKLSDIELIEADIRNADAVRNAVRGVDAVCHLAFINGTQYFYELPELVLDVGVKGMCNVLDACIENNVGELILASSSEVYQHANVIPTPETVPLIIPDPLNPRYSYAAGKIISEIMALNYSRKYFEKCIIFRPHNVYGPNMGWEHVIPQFVVRMKEACANTAKNEVVRFPIQGTGTETRAFNYIDDFIKGLSALLKKGSNGEIYHIGTQEEVPIEDVVHLIADYFGRKVEIVPGAMAEGGTPRRCPDTTKLAALGYAPSVPLAKGIQITAKWYDENAHKQKSTITTNLARR